MLRRIERRAVLSCAIMAIGAWAIARGRVDAPLGVLGGGALVWISYRGIKSGVDALTTTPRAHVALGLVKFFTRYGILAAAAYVIMARLRMPPLAVIGGASSLVVAVMIEAFRKKPPHNVD
jgi:hypothetical protein